MALEIERKFLIDAFPALPELRRELVQQSYLSTAPAVRIRRREYADGENTVVRFELCFKGKGTLARQEIEMPIEETIYSQLLELADGQSIRKDYRVYALEDGHRLECSHVDEGEPTAFLYAEVEFASLEEARAFMPPAFLGREVTEARGYGMASYWKRKTQG